MEEIYCDFIFPTDEKRTHFTSKVLFTNFKNAQNYKAENYIALTARYHYFIITCRLSRWKPEPSSFNAQARRKRFGNIRHYYSFECVLRFSLVETYENYCWKLFLSDIRRGPRFSPAKIAIRKGYWTAPEIFHRPICILKLQMRGKICEVMVFINYVYRCLFCIHFKAKK